MSGSFPSINRKYNTVTCSGMKQCQNEILLHGCTFSPIGNVFIAHLGWKGEMPCPGWGDIMHDLLRRPEVIIFVDHDSFIMFKQMTVKVQGLCGDMKWWILWVICDSSIDETWISSFTSKCSSHRKLFTTHQRRYEILCRVQDTSSASCIYQCTKSIRPCKGWIIIGYQASLVECKKKRCISSRHLRTTTSRSWIWSKLHRSHVLCFVRKRRRRIVSLQLKLLI